VAQTNLPLFHLSDVTSVLVETEPSPELEMSPKLEWDAAASGQLKGQMLPALARENFSDRGTQIPVQEGRARRFEQHLFIIGVEPPGRETATAKPAERSGEPGGKPDRLSKASTWPLLCLLPAPRRAASN
jgi:hypothetical protein